MGEGGFWRTKSRRESRHGIVLVCMIKQHIDWPMCRERGVGPKKRKARVMACVGARSKSTGRILMRRERCMKDLKWKRNNVHGGLGKL